MTALAIDFCVTSDRGLVRKDNQDSHFEDSARGVFCVADGMGGGADGGLASAWVCDEVRRKTANLAQSVSPEERRRAIEEGVAAAHRRIAAHAQRSGYGQMASTAVVLALDAVRRFVDVFNVGDSRAYRFHRGEIEKVTRDHTMGAELEAALGGDASRGLAVRSNPIAHVLTRAVGMSGGLDGEWRRIELSEGDVFLVCSDGVNDMLDDKDLTEILSSAKDPEAAIRRLVRGVTDAGAADNYTMIVLKARGDDGRKPS